jgi:hypothetical protein
MVPCQLSVPRVTGALNSVNLVNCVGLEVRTLSSLHCKPAHPDTFTDMLLNHAGHL